MTRLRSKSLLLATSAAAALCAAGPAHAIFPDASRTPDQIIDTANQFPYVAGIVFYDNGNNSGGCTGTLVNHRLVITAAHCVVRARSDNPAAPNPVTTAYVLAEGERYTLTGTNRLGVTFIPSPGAAIGNWNGTSNDTIVAVSDVIVHPDYRSPTFGDYTLLSLADPVANVPTAAVLLSPLDRFVQVLLAGYGMTGSPTEGGSSANCGNAQAPACKSDNQRRWALNQLGGLISDNGLRGGNDQFGTQLLYLTDFDSSTTAPGQRASAADFDSLPGSALNREGTTAPGDSGSGLIWLNGAFGPVHLGALGGGVETPNGRPSGFGDVSWFNPSLLFHQFLVENNPLVNAGVRAGNGLWSDANRWVQLTNPEYYIIQGGQLVNAAPGGNEGGVAQTTGGFGPVNSWDGSGTRQPPADAPAAGLNDTIAGARITQPNPDVTAINFTPGTTPVGGNAQVFKGPGSTGFVPQNTNGTPGTAFAASARYFDVFLGAAGVTTLDTGAVTIDRFTISGAAGLTIAQDASMTTLLSARHMQNGFLNLNGTLTTHNYFLAGGLFTGNGTLRTAANAALLNTGGRIAPGGVNLIGALRVEGAFLQANPGSMEVELGLPVAGAGGNDPTGADSLTATGIVFLGGRLFIGALLNADGSRRPVNDAFNGYILRANALGGTFGEVTNGLPGLLFPRITYRNDGVELSIGRQAITERIEQGALPAQITDLRTGAQPGAPVALGEPGVNLGAAPGAGAAAAVATTGAGTGGNFTDPRTGRSFSAGPTFDLSPLAEILAAAWDEARDDPDFDDRLEQSFDWLDVEDMFEILNDFTEDTFDETGGDIDFETANAIEFQIGDRLAALRGDTPRAFLASNRNVQIASSGATMSDAANPLLPAARDSGVFFAIDAATGRTQPQLTGGKNRFEAYTLTIGADHRFAPDFAAGLAMSFGEGESRSTGGNETRTHHWALTAYAGYESGHFYADAHLGVSFTDYNFVTQITFPAPATVRGQTDGHTLRAAMRAGYSLYDDGATDAGAFMVLRHRALTIDGYAETGGGVFNLTFAERTLRETSAGLGFEISHVFENEAGARNFALFAEAAWMNAFAQDGYFADAAFSETPDDPFRLPSEPPGRNWARLGAGFAAAAGEGVTITMRGSADVGRARYESYGGSVAVRMAF